MLQRLRDNPPRAVAAQPEVDLREALRFLWRRWRMIAGAGALALLAGALHLSRQTPLYSATAQVLLDPRKEKVGGQDFVLTDVNMDLPYLESQIAVIRSTALLRRVAESERLAADREFGAARADGGLLAAFRRLASSEPPPPPPPPAPARAGEDDSLQSLPPEIVAAVEALKGALAVARAGQALVLNVTFASADPAKAARLANAVADAYVVDKLESRFEAAKRASAWLGDRLVTLKKQVRDSEAAVARFRAENNLVAADNVAGFTLNQEQLGQLNGRLVTARAESAEKKARLDQLKRVLASGGSAADIPNGANAGTLPDLRRQENELTRREADLRARYSDRHPSVVNLRAELADIRRSIGAEADRLAGEVGREYDLALAREQAVGRALREVTGQTDLDASHAISLHELERSAVADKSLFEDLLQRSKVTEEQSTFAAREARVITPALPPGAPSSPDRERVLLTSLALGLAAGAGSAWLVERLNAGFTSPKQIEERLGLPLLAAIPSMAAADLAEAGGVLRLPELPIARPLSRFSEAVRALRGAVRMSDVDAPPRVLMIASTAPGEGKTTVALATAASAAHSGLRTLLIDADLRRASLSRYCGLQEEAGLVDYLVGQTPLSAAITFHDALKVFVLPAGARTQNPTDLIASDRFRSLIALLPQTFDLVIIDTPPLGPVVDPLIASETVDKVVFVVKWAATSRELVERAVERLEGRRRIAGVVFNQVVDAEWAKYGGAADSYHYGAGYEAYARE